jgi:hypothetical protein
MLDMWITCMMVTSTTCTASTLMSTRSRSQQPIRIVVRRIIAAQRMLQGISMVPVADTKPCRTAITRIISWTDTCITPTETIATIMGR